MQAAINPTIRFSDRPDRFSFRDKRVVAVIEDDPSMRKALARLLRAHGYACETCELGREVFGWVYDKSGKLCCL